MVCLDGNDFRGLGYGVNWIGEGRRRRGLLVLLSGSGFCVFLWGG